MTRTRALLGMSTRPTLKDVSPAGNLKDIFTGKTGQNANIFWDSYASETIQNCKNPTGHIDTLNLR